MFHMENWGILLQGGHSEVHHQMNHYHLMANMLQDFVFLAQNAFYLKHFCDEVKGEL